VIVKVTAWPGVGLATDHVVVDKVTPSRVTDLVLERLRFGEAGILGDRPSVLALQVG
jgi:hypothetical protein